MLTTSPSLDRTKPKKNAGLSDVNLCDVNLRDVKLCDVSVWVRGVNLCDVKLCDVNLCDVNLCDVNLCDVKLCDVNLCDVNLCDVKLCDVNLCDVNLCDVKLCDVSVRVCDVNLCGVCLRDVNPCNVNLCAQLPRTQFTHSTPPNPHASKTSAQNFRTSYWHSYPERNLHTARRQTRTKARHHNAKFSQLLSAQLPRTQFTHIKPPNPHARKTSTQNFRSSYWHSYPERNLHTSSRQTRTPGKRQRKIFAAPIGTPTPNATYTASRQTRMPAGHPRKIFAAPIIPRTQFTHSKPPNPHESKTSHTKFSQLLSAQLPRTQFTHSKAPNPHASKTSTQNFRSSYWHSYLNTKFSHLLLAQLPWTQFTDSKPQNPHASRTPNAVYTQRAAKPARQQDLNAKFSQLLLAQLLRTQFTHSTLQLHRTQFTHSEPPNPLARKTSTQHFRSSYCHRFSYCHSYPEHSLHTASRQTRMPAGPQRKIFAAPIGTATPRNLRATSCQTRMPGRHQRKIFAAPIGTATPNTIYTISRKSSGGARAPKRTSTPLPVQQAPCLPRKSPAGRAAARARQSVHQTPCQYSKPHACHAKAPLEKAAAGARQSGYQTPWQSTKPHACHAKAAAGSDGTRTPKRTSNSWKYSKPRLPSKSPAGRAAARARQSVHHIPPGSTASPTPATQSPAGRAAARARQSVHQTPWSTASPTPATQKFLLEERRPARAKAYIRPRGNPPSPTPATQKQRRAAAARARQSVHQTPWQSTKSHACHTKAAAGSGGPRTPKRTSDPV